MCNLLAVTLACVIVLFTVAIKFVLAFTFHGPGIKLTFGMNFILSMPEFGIYNLLFLFCLPPNLGCACWQNLGVRLPWFIMLSFTYVVGARIES